MDRKTAPIISDIFNFILTPSSKKATKKKNLKSVNLLDSQRDKSPDLFLESCSSIFPGACLFSLTIGKDLLPFLSFGDISHRLRIEICLYL
jgi:hypothetical protein